MLKENSTQAFIKEIGATLALVQGTLAEFECFIAIEEKKPEDIKEKTASLKES